MIPLAPLRALAERQLKELLKEPLTDLGSGYGVTLKSFEANLVEISSVRWQDARIEWGVKVTGNYRANFGIVPVNGSVVGEITLQQALSATTNCSLHSKSRVLVERLEFTVLAVPVSKVDWFKNLVRERLRDQLQNYATDLDDRVGELDWFRKGLDQQLLPILEGIQLSSDPDLWLQVRPSALHVSSLHCAHEKLVCYLGMDAFVTASLGRPSNRSPMGEVPIFLHDKRANKFAVNTLFHAGFPEWSALIRPLLTGFQQEVGFGTTVAIKEIELAPAGSAVAVKLKVESRGRLNTKAMLVLTGVPRFDAITEDVWLDELDYDLQTKNLPVKLVELFVHEGMRKRVAEAARYNLSDDMSRYKALANTAGKRYEVIPGVEFSGKLTKLDLSDLRVQPNGVVVALAFNGKGGFVVHKLPFD